MIHLDSESECAMQFFIGDMSKSAVNNRHCFRMKRILSKTKKESQLHTWKLNPELQTQRKPYKLDRSVFDFHNYHFQKNCLASGGAICFYERGFSSVGFLNCDDRLT